MSASDAKPVPQKNVAYRITFPILDADGDLVVGAASLDSEISKDGGTFTDCTNEATEIATSSGMYFLDLTATEMNADTVAIIVKTATAGAKTTALTLYPEEAGDIRVNVIQVGGTTQTAGDIIARLPLVLVGGRMDSSVGAMPADIITSTVLATSAINEIQAGLALESTSTAIKGKTDQLTFTTAGKVDSTIQAAGDFAQGAADKTWLSASRTLTAFGFSVTVGTNTDKTGYSLIANAVDAAQFTQAAADKIWTSATRTLTSLGVAAIQSIWDILITTLTVSGSIGKWIIDNLNTTVDSRASQTSVDTKASQISVDDLQGSIDLMDMDIATIKTKTDQLPSAINKNQPFDNFPILMVSETDHVTGVTGLSITAQRSLDGGAFGPCTNSPTETGNGIYKLNLSAADLNANSVVLLFTATGADPRVTVIIPKP